MSLFSVALAGFSAFLNLYATQPLLPYFTQVFHASKWEVSLTISATTCAVSMAAPFIGLIADLLGRKRIIMLAVFGLSIPTILAASASGLYSLIWWRFVQGLFLPAIFAVTIAYIGEEWEKSRIGSAMSAYVTGNIIGGVSGRFLSGLIAVHFGWRWVFITLGVLNLACGIAISMWMPKSLHFIREKNVFNSVRAIGQHLRNPHLQAAYAIGFNVLFSIVATFTYVNFYLAAPPFQFGPVALGSVFFVYLFGIVVVPIAGKWIDQVGYRIALATALATASIGVLLTLCPVPWLVMTGLAICAAGIFVSQSAANSYVGMATDHARSLAAGFYVAFYYLGGSLGAILPGFVWSMGGWIACTILIVLVQFLTIFIVLVICQDSVDRNSLRKG